MSLPAVDNNSAEYRVLLCLQATGMCRVAGVELMTLLGPTAAESWPDFAKSWDRLGPDVFMADGGRYRQRRHGTFQIRNGAFARKPHQPHFQSRDHNRLNGDVQRWFEPVEDGVSAGPMLNAVFVLCNRIFSRAGLDRRVPNWHVEVHQFRIETSPGHVGRPTPEGMHRDGVDWVFVMLVDRRNAADGVTQIGSGKLENLDSFTLMSAGDAAFLDDHRVLHGVTPIHAIDPSLPAYRDVLVVTFAAESTKI